MSVRERRGSGQWADRRVREIDSILRAAEGRTSRGKYRGLSSKKTWGLNLSIEVEDQEFNRTLDNIRKGLVALEGRNCIDIYKPFSAYGTSVTFMPGKPPEIKLTPGEYYNFRVTKACGIQNYQPNKDFDFVVRFTVHVMGHASPLSRDSQGQSGRLAIPVSITPELPSSAPPSSGDLFLTPPPESRSLEVRSQESPGEREPLPYGSTHCNCSTPLCRQFRELQAQAASRRLFQEQ